MNAAENDASQEKMIQEQIVRRGMNDRRIIAAMLSVPRRKFFPAELIDEAFEDAAFPIGHGQTISQPYVVALMTEQLDAQRPHRVLEIGTGSGYQTAILANLASKVYTIERVKPLLDSAFERLSSLGIRNVQFRFGDGSLGWKEEAPFDRILIAAAAPALPKALLREQLVDGGIAVLPVGTSNEQFLIRVRRVGEELLEESIAPVRFVPLVGEQGFSEAR